MTADCEGMRWCVISGFELLMQQWDDEVVLFHSGTGNTHLIESNACQLIQILQQSPEDTTGLIRSLSARLSLDQEELAAYVQRALVELQRLDILALEA